MENTKTIIKNPLIQLFIKSVIHKYHIHIYKHGYTLNDLYMDIITQYQINIYEYKLLNTLNNIIGYKHI